MTYVRDFDGDPMPDDGYCPEPPPGRFDDEPASGTRSAPPTDAWPELDATGIFAPLEPVKYLLGALDMCPGAPVLFAGYGFSGKTVTAQALAIAIAAGVPALGSFTVPHGKVLHVDYEQGPRLTRSKYQRLACAMMIAPSDIDGRLTLVSMPQFYLDGGLAEDFLVRKCTGVDLMIVDSLRAACPNIDENDSQVRLVLDMLTRVSVRTGCTVVVIHHARKPQREAAGGAKMAIRGSGAIFDACGSVLVFEAAKGEPIRISHEKARTSGRTAEDFQIRIEDAEHNGVPCGGLLVFAEGLEPKAQHTPGAELDALKERVRAHFREHGDQPGKGAIRSRLGVKRDALFAALAELEADGEIVNTGNRTHPNLHLREATKP